MELKEAHKLGKEAYEQGRPRIPVNDPRFREMMERMKNGLLPVIKAWLAGWHEGSNEHYMQAARKAKDAGPW